MFLLTTRTARVLGCTFLVAMGVGCSTHEGGGSDGADDVAGRSGAGGDRTAGASGTGQTPSATGGNSSSSSSEPGAMAPDTASAGEGGGGASLDAGAMQPEIVPPRSLRQACLAYFDARNDRLLECGHVEALPGAPAPSALECPDALFAEGSTFTIDSAFACAETWRAHACADVARGLWPACDRSGTRQAEQTCRFHAQCESASCLGAGPTPSCSTCLPVHAAGGPCDVGSDVCEVGMVCFEGTCRVPPALDPVALGEPCERDEQCPLQRQRCVDGSGGVLRCQEPAGEGEPCATWFGMHLCEVGLRCDADGLCRAPSGAGERCLHEADGGAIWCGVGTYCDDANDTCTALPPLGEACATREEVTGLRCADDARCEADRCVARIGLGEACSTAVPEWAGNCVRGATCVCSDLACQLPGVCKQLAEEGAPCTAEHAQCVVGTTCEAGVCTSVDSLGLFEALDCTAP